MPPYIYVSAWDPSGLTIVDATGNMATWGTVGHILSTGPTPLNNPAIMLVYRGTAYIPCQAGYVSLVDVSDPTNPGFLSSIGSIGAPNFTDGANHCQLRQNGLLYVASIIDNAVSIFDVSNPAAPVLVGSIQGVGAPNFLGNARTIDVDDNLVAFVAASSDNSLTCIDVSNPAAPAYLGRIAGAGAPNRLSSVRRAIKIGNYVYTCAFFDPALSVFDVTDPANPVLHGQVVNGNLGSAYDMVIYGNYAYVSCQLAPNGRMTIIDITNPAAPAYVNNVTSWRINSTRGNSIFQRSFPNIYICGTAVVTDAMVWFEVTDPLVINFVGQIVGAGAPNYMGAPQSVACDTYFTPIPETRPATGVT